MIQTTQPHRPRQTRPILAHHFEPTSMVLTKLGTPRREEMLGSVERKIGATLERKRKKEKRRREDQREKERKTKENDFSMSEERDKE